MTDEQLILKKLAFIETCLKELASLANPSAIETDVKERRFIEHTLQIVVQATQDVASHIVSDQKLGEPSTNQELFTLLARGGFIDDTLAGALRAAVGFRNVVVHGYTAVAPGIVRDVVENLPLCQAWHNGSYGETLVMLSPPARGPSGASGRADYAAPTFAHSA